ncbi:MAG: transglycosylase SLT domain-containing protein [Prevotellaceae bacterium]|nr:transglycosylase SLT domain-containing protein [Prevotellaceae bacterium]
MKQLALLIFFAVLTLCGRAQTNPTETLEDTTINPGRTIIVNGDEILEPDVDDNLDNLLSIWYLQRALRDTADTDYNLDQDVPIADLPDSIYIERLKTMPTPIDLPYNHLVRNSIIYYTQRIPEKSEMILGLAQYYLPMVEEILDMYDMPLELRAMAIIESALNPRAVSRAKAKGMWQFMYRTALLYNLKINSYVDERLDPVAATHAAARYMKDLYGIFGDWSLAIAAYNCGAGNVNKAIRRSGGKRSYWDIYPYLPRETRGYVPNFVAACYLLEYYKQHRLQPKSVCMPAQIDTFQVTKMLHFEQVSEVIGISIDELRDFNPQYLHDIVPGTSAPYILNIPYEYTAQFAEKEQDIYGYKDSIYFNPNIIQHIARRGATAIAGDRSQLTHRIRPGETLGAIALQYGVKVSDLKYWNNLRSERIIAGKKLIVGSAAVKKQRKPAATATATAPSGSYIIHTVKSGESLFSIAERYDNITYYDLMKLNNYTKKSKIYPGDKIKIGKL